MKRRMFENYPDKGFQVKLSHANWNLHFLLLYFYINFQQENEGRQES